MPTKKIELKNLQWEMTGVDPLPTTAVVDVDESILEKEGTPEFDEEMRHIVERIEQEHDGIIKPGFTVDIDYAPPKPTLIDWSHVEEKNRFKDYIEYRNSKYDRGGKAKLRIYRGFSCGQIDLRDMLDLDEREFQAFLQELIRLYKTY